jgi:hypothetical protein
MGTTTATPSVNRSVFLCRMLKRTGAAQWGHLLRRRPRLMDGLNKLTPLLQRGHFIVIQNMDSRGFMASLFEVQVKQNGS